MPNMPRVKKTETKEFQEKQTKVKKTDSSLTIPVYDLTGKEISKLEMPKEIVDTKVNKSLLAQYVRVYLANQRTGTASTKTRGEVTGSTKKIYRQKGTGRARHGAKKAPIFVGGGITFGPLPHNFSLKMNKKQKRKALFDALNVKFKEGNIIGLSREVKVNEVKTKTIAEFLKIMSINKTKILFVMPEKKDVNLSLSARNIESVSISGAYSINPYLLLTNNKVLFLEEAWDNFKSYFLKNSANK